MKQDILKTPEEWLAIKDKYQKHKIHLKTKPQPGNDGTLLMRIIDYEIVAPHQPLYDQKDRPTNNASYRFILDMESSGAENEAWTHVVRFDQVEYVLVTEIQ